MQNSLFESLDDPTEPETHDLGNAEIEEYPHAFNGEDNSRLMTELIDTVPWHGDTITIAGKQIPVPRLQCWMGDIGSRYGYSGMRLSPQPWLPIVNDIRNRVFGLTGLTFNSVLLNYYRDGQDSVAWHADDEPELGKNPIIASLSLGAQREFQLCPKNSKSRAIKARILLRPGSLLVMGKGLQDNWLHQVPKVKGLTEPRLNLTFRNILNAAPEAIDGQF